GFDEPGQVGEPAIMQGFAVEVQQAAGRSFTGRVLGNQFGRQGEIEVVEREHVKMSSGRLVGDERIEDNSASFDSSLANFAG
ncbi:MAG: hypothetical protein H6R16_2943, partial [Proteobacteria bacterium]|nr:hypothetical protein [Pseudomonadota bacterium]